MQITINNELASLLRRRSAAEGVGENEIAERILDEGLKEYQIPLISTIKVIEVLPIKCGREYSVTEDFFMSLTDIYDGEFVKFQLKQMKLWLENNPKKRKTEKGTPRFITSWLLRNDTGDARRECRKQLKSGLAALEAL